MGGPNAETGIRTSLRLFQEFARAFYFRRVIFSQHDIDNKLKRRAYRLVQ